MRIIRNENKEDINMSIKYFEDFKLKFLGKINNNFEHRTFPMDDIRSDTTSRDYVIKTMCKKTIEERGEKEDIRLMLFPGSKNESGNCGFIDYKVYRMGDLQSRLEDAKRLEFDKKYKKSDDLLSELIKLAEENEDSLLPSLYNYRGITRRGLGQFDKAFEDYKKVFDLNSDKEQKASAFINLADICRMHYSNFEDAHEKLNSALSQVESGNLERSLTHTRLYYQRGLVFFAEKEYDKAIDSYGEGIEILERLVEEGGRDVKKSLWQNLNGIAVAYVFLGDSDEMDEAYNFTIRALDLSEEIKDQQGIFNCVATLGRIAEIKKDYDGAITQYKRGWDILEKTKDGRSITTLSLHLAEAYLENDQSSEAKPYLERFTEGIINEEITNHDMNILSERYQKLKLLYDKSGLNINNFGDLNL